MNSGIVECNRAVAPPSIILCLLPLINTEIEMEKVDLGVGWSGEVIEMGTGATDVQPASPKASSSHAHIIIDRS